MVQKGKELNTKNNKGIRLSDQRRDQILRGAVYASYRGFNSEIIASVGSW